MDSLIYTLGVVVFFVGLMASIALHEVGHMWPAKKFDVKVTEYFVGFGRRIWSFRRGETEYGIKAIPLGGYVKLVGMLPPAKDAPVETGDADHPHPGAHQQHRHVHPAGRRRPRLGVRAGPAGRRGPAVLPQALVAEADHHGRRADDERADRRASCSAC